SRRLNMHTQSTCSFFFLYDGSKVRGEGDPTREGICYFYPEETPLDRQELLCGQLAGVGRCVSELSVSPVRVLRLRRDKFAIRMKDDLFWALGTSVEVPTVSVCALLDQLINLFRFYNGSVRRSYQIHSRETLAARWAQYLSHLQSGSSELHHIFSCLRTIDSTNVDPLLLLKAALILQACQRCPLVLAGCVLFRGRVVSTQMSPELTMKAMVHESETYVKVGTTPITSHATPLKDTPPRKTRLSRTLSDVPSTESDPPDPGSPQPPQNLSFGPVPSQGAAESLSCPDQSPSSNGEHGAEGEESRYFSFQTAIEEDVHQSGDRGDTACAEASQSQDRKVSGESGGGGPPPGSSSGAEEAPLVPMTLYLHRVKSLVLVLLVEQHFLSDSASMEEVYHSSLASLNGLEAHLRTVSPAAPGAPGPYSFAHFDCVQSTLTANVSAAPGGAPERPFVRAVALLHSHFSDSASLQEAIIRSAGAAVYGTRSVAQETFFQQHGGSLRNSGIPNQQDSCFSLPSKARHRLLKHGVNLL
uniref:Uncharacterized protein n=1 Tax=Mola mola TaxID=94237 RepID=A0A3Q3WA99_MOLML